MSNIEEMEKIKELFRTVSRRSNNTEELSELCLDVANFMFLSINQHKDHIEKIAQIRKELKLDGKNIKKD